MKIDLNNISWKKGVAPVAVILISLNEGHNMDAVLKNLSGWAQEVFLVDSYSKDSTVDIALRYGVHVVQRRFQGFGDQWNFALRELPITSPWTMKLDPDERLTDDLKGKLLKALEQNNGDAFSMVRRLWFMGRPLSVRQTLVRLWRTGYCRFTDVAVNEHPIVEGQIVHITAEIGHNDSPDLDHWLEKQNRYSTAEAIMAYHQSPMADTPKLFGTTFQRRMWKKKFFRYIPFRFSLFFFYNWLIVGAWRAGWVGYAWAQLRSEVMRLRYYKHREMEITGRMPANRYYGPGMPDHRVIQY